MPITAINRYFVGNPNIVGIVTTENLSQITTEGYFASQEDAIQEIQNGLFQFTETDIELIFYADGIGFFTYDPDTDAFVANGTPGEIILPVITGHFANWANTDGALSDQGYVPSSATNKTVANVNKGQTPVVGYIPAFTDTSGTVGIQTPNAVYLVNGDFRAGGAGLSGILVSNPSAISSGVLIMQAVNVIAGDFSSTIQNSTALLASRTYHLPEPAVSSSVFAIIPEFPVSITADNLMMAGSAQGTIVDSSVPVAAVVRTDTNSTYNTTVKTSFSHELPVTIDGGNNVTSNQQGGIIQTNDLTTASGAQYNFTLNNSLLTATSSILLQLQYGTNTKFDIECTLKAPPTNGSVVITLQNNNSTAMDGNMKVYFFIPY